MKYLSICSGIEAASVAWAPLGWEPVAFAEIEAFPSALLAHRYPDVPNWGDITKFREWPDATFDVLIGGTPCQSFSVAGLRKGLADPRGNLCLTYLAVLERYRPEWCAWENVPGVMSSGGGRDFGSFIGGLGELGYHAAWRVLDAQYVRVDGFARAVPQRRRRIFVVGHSRNWRCAAAVLFERESLLWNNPPSRKPGQAAAPTISARTRSGGGLGTDFDCDGGLVQSVSGIGGLEEVSHALMGKAQKRLDHTQETHVIVSGAISSKWAKGTGGPAGDECQNLVVAQPQAFYSTLSRPDDVPPAGVSLPLKVGSNGGGQAPAIAFSCKDHGADADDETAPTLRAMGHADSHANAGGQVAVAFAQNSRDELRLFGDDGQTVGAIAAEPGMKQQSFIATAFQPRHYTRDNRTGGAPSDVSHPLASEDHIGDSAQAVVFKPSHYTRDKDGAPSDVMPPLTKETDKGDQAPLVFQSRIGRNGRGQPGEVVPALNGADAGTTSDMRPCIASAAVVRRLTPRECERLQGFPDDYTAVPYRGRQAADGPRYKALGNSMAVNVMRWLGRRIELVRSLNGGRA